MLSKLYHLLQITLLQHFAATPSFLLFYFYKASPNAQLALYPKIGSNCCNIFEVIPFAANDTVLQHFQQLEKNCKKNLSESIQKVKLLLCTVFGGNGNNSKIVSFAANYTILQHFSANPSIFEIEIVLNHFRLLSQPCILSFELIAAIHWKLYHLLQMIPFCSILQQPDGICKRNLLESNQNAKLPQCTKLENN